MSNIEIRQIAHTGLKYHTRTHYTHTSHAPSLIVSRVAISRPSTYTLEPTHRTNTLSEICTVADDATASAVCVCVCVVPCGENKRVRETPRTGSVGRDGAVDEPVGEEVLTRALEVGGATLAVGGAREGCDVLCMWNIRGA